MGDTFPLRTFPDVPRPPEDGWPIAPSRAAASAGIALLGTRIHTLVVARERERGKDKERHYVYAFIFGLKSEFDSK